MCSDYPSLRSLLIQSEAMRGVLIIGDDIDRVKTKRRIKIFLRFHFCFNLQISYEANFSETTNNANTAFFRWPAWRYIMPVMFVSIFYNTPRFFELEVYQLQPGNIESSTYFPSSCSDANSNSNSINSFAPKLFFLDFKSFSWMSHSRFLFSVPFSFCRCFLSSIPINRLC